MFQCCVLLLGGGNQIYDEKSSAMFAVKKCTEVSGVTLTTLLACPLTIAWILFYMRYLNRKTLAKLKSSQLPKEHPNLVPKSQKVSMLTDENATWRNFARDLCCLLY